MIGNVNGLERDMLYGVMQSEHQPVQIFLVVEVVHARPDLLHSEVIARTR